MPETGSLSSAILVVGFSAAVVSGVAAYRAGGPYGERRVDDPRVHRVYDAAGKVTLVAAPGSSSSCSPSW